MCSVAQSCPTLCDPMEYIALSVGVSQQEHWSELPFPPLRDLPDPRVKPTSPALAGRIFTAIPTWEAPFNVLESYHSKEENKAEKREGCVRGC